MTTEQAQNIADHAGLMLTRAIENKRKTDCFAERMRAQGRADALRVILSLFGDYGSKPDVVDDTQEKA